MQEAGDDTADRLGTGRNVIDHDQRRALGLPAVPGVEGRGLRQEARSPRGAGAQAELEREAAFALAAAARDEPPGKAFGRVQELAEPSKLCPAATERHPLRAEFQPVGLVGFQEFQGEGWLRVEVRQQLVETSIEMLLHRIELGQLPQAKAEVL